VKVKLYALFGVIVHTLKLLYLFRRLEGDEGLVVESVAHHSAKDGKACARLEILDKAHIVGGEALSDVCARRAVGDADSAVYLFAAACLLLGHLEDCAEIDRCRAGLIKL
jgi:hypothetical protein